MFYDMLKFDLLGSISVENLVVSGFLGHFDHFCQYSKQETTLTWWKGMSGHSKLYVPWFADLHTDNSSMVSLSSSFIDIIFLREIIPWYSLSGTNLEALIN